MAQCACNSNIQEAVAGELQQVQGHPGIYTEFQSRINGEILSQITKTKKKICYLSRVLKLRKTMFKEIKQPVLFFLFFFFSQVLNLAFWFLFFHFLILLTQSSQQAQM